MVWGKLRTSKRDPVDAIQISMILCSLHVCMPDHCFSNYGKVVILELSLDAALQFKVLKVQCL